MGRTTSTLFLIVLAGGCQMEPDDTGSPEADESSPFASVRAGPEEFGHVAQREDGSGVFFGGFDIPNIPAWGPLEAEPADTFLPTLYGPLAAGLDGSVVDVRTGEDIRVLHQLSYDRIVLSAELQCGIQGDYAECARLDGLDDVISFDNVVDLAIHQHLHVLVLKPDGDLEHTLFGATVEKPDVIGPWTRLVQGEFSVCAQDPTGAWTCDDELFGQEHDEDPGPRDYATATYGAACAWDHGEDVTCWRIYDQQLVTPDVVFPPEGQYVSIGINASTGCGVTIDGDLRCWGDTTDVPEN